MNLSEVELASLAYAIAQYREQFGGGGVFAAATVGRLQAEGSDLEQNLVAQRQDALSQTRNEFLNVLAATGLGLELVAGSDRLHIGTSQIASSHMRINLVRGGTFVRYLAALYPDILTKNQILGLLVVAQSLTEQLSREYRLDDGADDRMLQLFASMRYIVAGYRCLDPDGSKGLRSAVGVLATYHQIAQAGCLREHLLVRNAGLFVEVGGQNFGPSMWHTDTIPGQYREKWDRALEILAAVGANPKAEELFTRLRNHLKASLEFARQDLGERAAVFGGRGNLDNWRRIMDEVSRQLD